jgi:hypothetical protein
MLETAVNIVTCFERYISEVAFPRQLIWNIAGNRFAEAHVCGNTQATGIEFVENGVSFAVLPQLLQFRSLIEPQF